MFTGIVEEVGRVVTVEGRERGRALTIRAPRVARDLQVGASVSVDGACLTAVWTGEESFAVEVIGTTLSRTIAGGYGEGSRVNLERALEMGGRLEGHLVQGHVDGVVELLEVRREGDHRLQDFRIPRQVWDLTLLHGSIALNGVSLTVNQLQEPDRCQVALIPHTWSHTNLRLLQEGDRANVEGDLIGKYVGKIVGARGAREGEHPRSPEDANPDGK